jgi:hypothetical protein
MKKFILLIVLYFNILPLLNQEGRFVLIHVSETVAQGMGEESDACIAFPAWCEGDDECPTGDCGGDPCDFAPEMCDPCYWDPASCGGGGDPCDIDPWLCNSDPCDVWPDLCNSWGGDDWPPYDDSYDDPWYDDPDWLECFFTGNCWEYNNPGIACNTPYNSTNITLGVASYFSQIMPSNVFGLTYPEHITTEITACLEGGSWRAVLTGLNAAYSLQARLLQGMTEITGPGAGGNTTQANFCAQAEGLHTHGNSGNWYLVSAIQAHEEVHLSRFMPALQNIGSSIETLVEAITVPNTGQGKDAAILQIKNLFSYISLEQQYQQLWLAEVLVLVQNDHGTLSPTWEAEQAIADPMRVTICSHALINAWGSCTYCY